MDERMLIEDAKKGNKQALCILIENNMGILSGFVYKMTNDPFVCQDIVQETLLKAILHIDKFSPNVRFSTWLIKIAINVYKDYLRKNRRYTFLYDSFKDIMHETEQIAISNSQYEQMMKIIQSLDYKSKAVFVLKHFYGYKYDEIAKILSLPVGTVKSRLHHAVKFLLNEFKKKGVIDK